VVYGETGASDIDAALAAEGMRPVSAATRRQPATWPLSTSA
jgi:hypothetical protein